MNDSGEKELVLGNKQLLAIFFVGVLLCGVFFAVGYVVGGNSAKSLAGTATADGTAATSSSSSSEGKREEPQIQSIADNPAGSSPAPTDAGSSVPAAEPRMADNPAAAGSQPPAVSVPAASVPAVQAPAPQPVQAPPAVKTAAAAPAAATGIFISVPEKGASYVQVIATARPHADDMVRFLREARMPAILSESSKPELYEVLVGPYRAPLALADAKRKLTDLGYNNLIVHKQ